MDDKTEELIARARKGDVAAFEALIRPHLPAIRRFARGFAKRDADADDLAQEAVLKAFRSMAGFEGRSSLSTWLFAVTRSVALDSMRSLRARAEQRSEEVGEELSAEGPLPEHQVELEEQKALLWAALRQLPAEFRVPVVLVDIEGMNYEAVAAIEGVPVGTIRSRLSRAREKLKEILLDQEGIFPGRGTPAMALTSELERD